MEYNSVVSSVLVLGDVLIVSSKKTVLGLLCCLEQVCFSGTALRREASLERVEWH